MSTNLAIAQLTDAVNSMIEKDEEGSGEINIDLKDTNDAISSISEKSSEANTILTSLSTTLEAFKDSLIEENKTSNEKLDSISSELNTSNSERKVSLTEVKNSISDVHDIISTLNTNSLQIPIKIDALKTSLENQLKLNLASDEKFNISRSFSKFMETYSNKVIENPKFTDESFIENVFTPSDPSTEEERQNLISYKSFCLFLFVNLNEILNLGHTVDLNLIKELIKIHERWFSDFGTSMNWNQNITDVMNSD